MNLKKPALTRVPHMEIRGTHHARAEKVSPELKGFVIDMVAIAIVIFFILKYVV